jgi:hypothetical protein
LRPQRESKTLPPSAPSVVDRRGNDEDQATKDDETRREVSAVDAVDTDQAIRTAAKAAIDAGDVTRARALLELLDAKPPAPLLTLATIRRAPTRGK